MPLGLRRSKKDEIKVRKAKAVDLGEIKRLYRQLFAEMARLDPVRFREAEQDETLVLNLISDDSAAFLIAEGKEGVMGFALMLEDFAPDYRCVAPRKTAVLMDLVTDEPYRGRGVGKALLKAARIWACDHGARHLQLNCLSNNRQALRFYRRNGLYPTSMTMECEI